MGELNYTKGEWKTLVTDHFIQVFIGEKGTITLAWSEENIANAQLISTAPRNYEDLKTIHALATCSEYIDFTGTKQALKDIAEIAELAIKITEGK